MVSVKAVAIGGLVDVGMSVVLEIPLAVYAVSHIGIAHGNAVESPGALATVVAAIRGNPALYATQLSIGLVSVPEILTRSFPEILTT